jgi:hypothetical protein
MVASNILNKLNTPVIQFLYTIDSAIIKDILLNKNKICFSGNNPKIYKISDIKCLDTNYSYETRKNIINKGIKYTLPIFRENNEYDNMCKNFMDYLNNLYKVIDFIYINDIKYESINNIEDYKLILEELITNIDNIFKLKYINKEKINEIKKIIDNMIKFLNSINDFYQQYKNYINPDKTQSTYNTLKLLNNSSTYNDIREAYIDSNININSQNEYIKNESIFKLRFFKIILDKIINDYQIIVNKNSKNKYLKRSIQSLIITKNHKKPLILEKITKIRDILSNRLGEKLGQINFTK